MQMRNLNDLSYLIIQAAIEAHRALGPGLLESVYRSCLMYELRQRQLAFVAERLVPLCYKGVILDSAYRSDLLVEDQIVVEVKAIETVAPVHEAQLLSYLRLMNKPLGLLINFNVPLLTDGVTRRNEWLSRPCASHERAQCADGRKEKLIVPVFSVHLRVPVSP